VFESRERLGRDIAALLGVLRGLAQGRYACLVEPKGILFEDPAPEDGGDWALRRFLEGRATALFALPASLAAAGPMEDVFEGWDDDDFFLAFVNGRVGLVVACPDAESFRARVDDPLRILGDRLIRWNPSYRLDPQGRGFFFSAAKLEVVVVGRDRS
jgi:hypothetical protein